MTAREVRQLSHTDLDALYATLRADRLPVGTFDGVTWPVPVWPFWRGKVFSSPFTVCNRILGHLWFSGEVYLIPIHEPSRLGCAHYNAQTVVIKYDFWRRIGLTDYLKPISDTLWLGYLRLGPVRVWFTLEQKP